MDLVAHAFIFFGTLFGMMDDNITVQNQAACSQHTIQEVKQRARYHGTYTATCDNGTWYFYRDGHKYRLFPLDKKRHND